MKRKPGLTFWFMTVLIANIGGGILLGYLDYKHIVDVPEIPFIDQLFEAESYERDNNEILCGDTQSGIEESVPEVSVISEPVNLTLDERAYMRCADRPSFEAFPLEIYTYTGIEDSYCYNKPGATGYIVTVLQSGTKLSVVGKEGSDYVVRIDDGIYGYVSDKNVAKGELYASMPDAVDLRGFIPEAVYDIRFSTEHNITGNALYPPIPFLEEHAAIKLKEASDTFFNDGYLLQICDAYRPVTAQSVLYQTIDNPKHVPNPNHSPSWHNVGKAVDIMLIDKNTGSVLATPTELYTFSEEAQRSSVSSWSYEASQTVEYMTQVMISAGFEPISDDWWHYEYTGRDAKELPQTLDYSSVIYEEAS